MVLTAILCAFLLRYLLTPADKSAGLSSEDVALNGRTLAMVGAGGSNPKLPDLIAHAKTGSALSLPGLSFGFFGEWGPTCLISATIRYTILSELGNPG